MARNYCFVSSMYENNQSCWNDVSVVRAKNLVDAMGKYVVNLRGKGISVDESSRKTMATWDERKNMGIPCGYMFEADSNGKKCALDVTIKVGTRYCSEI